MQQKFAGVMKKVYGYLMISFMMICMMSNAVPVHAAGIASNLLEQIQPYYTYRCSSGTASLAGETYDECLLFNTYNTVPGEAAFYLEGKYSSISFSVAHENGTQTRTVTVYCDDTEVWSEEIGSDDLPHSSGRINLSGVQELKITVSGSSSTFNTAVGNINLVSSGYTREERMQPVESNFLTCVQAYNSYRYSTGDIVMGDKNYPGAIGFDTFNSVAGHATYNLQGRYKTMSFWLGNSMNSVSAQSRTVTISGDGTQLFSKAVDMDDAPAFYSINITDVHQLKIEVSGSPSCYQVVLGGINLVSDGVVRGISLDQASLSLNALNPTSYLKATIVPTDAANQNIIWSSSDEAVATVNAKGLVTAVMDGNAVITATTVSGGYTASCDVSVSGMSVDMEDTSVSVSDVTYTGSAIKAPVTVKYNGATLTAGTDYTVSYSNNVNAGTATAVITGKRKYNGSVTKTFKIEKAEQELHAAAGKDSIAVGSKTKISVTGKGSITYTSLNKKRAKVSSSGTVTAKAPGTVKIKINASGNSNYKAAEAIVEIKVNPKSTKITSAVNSEKRKITVKWSKVSGVSGYQVKYVTGSVKRTVTVKKASSVSKKLTGLKKGKTYKIYVRSYKSVSGEKYYSEWSKVKKVKVRK